MPGRRSRKPAKPGHSDPAGNYLYAVLFKQGFLTLKMIRAGWKGNMPGIAKHPEPGHRMARWQSAQRLANKTGLAPEPGHFRYLSIAGHPPGWNGQDHLPDFLFPGQFRIHWVTRS